MDGWRTIWPPITACTMSFGSRMLRWRMQEPGASAVVHEKPLASVSASIRLQGKMVTRSDKEGSG